MSEIGLMSPPPWLPFEEPDDGVDCAWCAGTGVADTEDDRLCPDCDGTGLAAPKAVQ